MDAKLRQRAEDLGITVDSRWSDTTLQQKIDEKEADNKAAGSGGIIPGYKDKDYKGPSKEALMGAAVDDKGNVLPTEATPKATKSGIIPADEKARVRAKAETLGILVDDKWDLGRLRGEIQMARMGRADLQVKGAVPPAEWGDLEFDPTTKADKEGKIPGTISVEPVKIPGVTIAGEPAVAMPGAPSMAVATSTAVSK